MIKSNKKKTKKAAPNTRSSITLNDEQIAHTLANEEMIAHVANDDTEIARSLQSDEWNNKPILRREPRPSSSSSSTGGGGPIVSFSRSTNKPTPFVGKVVAKSTKCQFDLRGGSSACTSICLYTAAQFLLFNNNYKRNDNAQQIMSTRALDRYLDVGVTLHHEITEGDVNTYTSVDDLWDAAPFSSIVADLERLGLPINGRASKEFKSLLKIASSRASDISIAIVITKPPETILIFFEIKGGQWFIFDSHGRQFDFPRKAYVEKLSSMDQASKALSQRFPGASDYEAHVICLKREFTA